MVAPNASPRGGNQQLQEDDDAGEPFAAAVLSTFLQSHPPPWFEQGADHEIGHQELIFVLGHGETEPVVVNSALAMLLELFKDRDSLTQISQSGGIEALIALVSGEHHQTRAQVLDAAASAGGDAESLGGAFVGRLIRAQAGQLMHRMMPIEGVKRRLHDADRVKIATGLLDAARDAWQDLPADAMMLGALLDAVALAPLMQAETFALIDGPRLDFVLSVLRAAVSWRGPHARAAGPDDSFASNPECLAAGPQRACVALYTTSLMLKTLTGGPRSKRGEAFVQRLRAVLPRAAGDLGRLFEVHVASLASRDLGPNTLTACLLGLAHEGAAIMAAASEVPEAAALREGAMRAGEGLRAVSQQIHGRFMEAWGPGSEAEPAR